jgi:hypothetical protein
MKHAEIRWNPELQEWFCVRCGRTSDHISKKDAEVELDFTSCRNRCRPSRGRRSPRRLCMPQPPIFKLAVVSRLITYGASRLRSLSFTRADHVTGRVSENPSQPLAIQAALDLEVPMQANRNNETAPPTLAEIEVRPRAVLPGSGCAEHQATGALPQPANSTAACNDLVVRSRETVPRCAAYTAQQYFRATLFQHPRLITTVENPRRRFFLGVA